MGRALWLIVSPDFIKLQRSWEVAVIKPGALVMAAAMAAVSAGTYYGLGMLPPGLIPPPIGRVPPVVSQPIAQNVVTATGASAPATPAAAAPVPAAAATDTHAAPTEQELAEEPAPKQVATAEPAPAAKPAPAAAPAAAPAKAETKPEAKAESKPETAPAAEAAPAPRSAPKAKAAKAAAPAATPAAAPAEAAPEKSPETTPVTPSKTTADSDALKQWWPEPSKLPATQLKLMYAGDVQGESAIGLLFSEAPNLDSLKLHAHVREVSGKDVGGIWEAGKNPRLVVFRGLKTGRYTVILDRELADIKGFALGQTLQGAVYIPAH
jgi:hypothetical protein